MLYFNYEKLREAMLRKGRKFYVINFIDLWKIF